MKWRRAVLVVVILLAIVLTYQFAYLASALAKMMGHGDAFDRWHGSVSRSTIQVAGITTDVYSGKRQGFPVVMIHGVNADGKNSAELRSLAEILATAGYRVIAPDMVRMTHQNVSPEDIDDVAAVFGSLSSDGAMVCASYGCGPALVAATRPGIRDKVRFIVTYGAYFDFIDTLRFIITAPPSPLAYSKWAYMAANADLVEDNTDRMSVIALARERENLPSEEWSLGAECLGVEGRAMLDLFEAETPQQFDERLGAVPALQDRLTRLSPSRYFSKLKASLVIIHIGSDPSIPSSESIRLAHAANGRRLPYSLTILNMYGHTRPLLPPVGIRSLLFFYLPESVKTMRVMHEILFGIGVAASNSL